MNIRFPILILAVLLALLPGVANGQVTITDMPAESRVDITINGALFTQYHYSASQLKPYLYPVRTATGKDAQRHYSIVAGVPGESQDHPHHQSLYFVYGSVDGNDYWSNHRTAGRVIHSKIVKITEGGDSGALVTESEWTLPYRAAHLIEHRTMTFSGDGANRIIDFDMTLTAANDDVVFEDTKEGMFAFRVGPGMREPDRRGRYKANARYFNAEGLETEKNIWGKKSKWVALQGEVDGEPTLITIMHHPTSTEYPTYWHARGYGLFAANPFGRKDFDKGSEPLNFTLKKGESAIFRFRVLIHSGDLMGQKAIEANFQEYVKTIQ